MDGILELWEKAPNGEQLLKALEEERMRQMRIREPRSAIIDPYNVYGTSGTRTKQSIISYTMLRNMAKVPPVAAIINTRLNQVARFSRRPRYDGDTGFMIIHKDKTTKMTQAQRKRAVEIEDFFLHTGFVKNARRKDNFNTFLRKIVTDSLVLDVMTWENVPNYKGELAEIWAVDAATIELVTNGPVSEMKELPVYEPVTPGGMKLGADRIAYVQRVNGEIVAEYTEDMLAYAVRNPRTDLATADFGQSELEVLIEIVTGILNGIRYNTTYFTHSHLPQGILEIVGKYSDEHLEAFKRHWRQLTSGAAGKWAVPVIAMTEGQGVKFTPFKNSNKDMEFNEFLEFLFNITCAVYQIDPNEVGFKSWTSGSSMTQSDHTVAKIESSKDKGFIPLMTFLSDTFNSEIVDRIDPEFEFVWVGLDEEDEDRKIDRQQKQVQMGSLTIAEVRKANDQEELINPETGKPWLWTQAPANPQLLQVFMAESGIGKDGQEGGQAGGQEEEGADEKHEREQERADDEHEKQLELMERQHELEMEKKKADHEHEIKMAQLKAKQAANIQKSLNVNEDGTQEIVITWDEY